MKCTDLGGSSSKADCKLVWTISRFDPVRPFVSILANLYVIGNLSRTIMDRMPGPNTQSRSVFVRKILNMMNTLRARIWLQQRFRTRFITHQPRSGEPVCKGWTWARAWITQSDRSLGGTLDGPTWVMKRILRLCHKITALTFYWLVSDINNMHLIVDALILWRALRRNQQASDFSSSG